MLIVEVLSPRPPPMTAASSSPTTAGIAPVAQILVVASEDRHVEVWRGAKDGWRLRDLIGDAAIPLAIDGQPLPVVATYDGAELSRQREPGPRPLSCADADFPGRRGFRGSR